MVYPPPQTRIPDDLVRNPADFTPEQLAIRTLAEATAILNARVEADSVIAAPDSFQAVAVRIATVMQYAEEHSGTHQGPRLVHEDDDISLAHIEVTVKALRRDGHPPYDLARFGSQTSRLDGWEYYVFQQKNRRFKDSNPRVG